MIAASPLLYFGIVGGLLFANQVTSSCVVKENLSKGLKETSCSNQALTSVPVKDIPQDTGILTLSFNKLKDISTSTFKEMKQLLELDLSDNDLTSFKVDVPIMLKELILANNLLKSIPDLSQLSSLTRLVLSNNHISSITDSAFNGLKNLRVLELQKNSIDSLPEKVFEGLQNLDHLDLSNNILWELPTHLISKLKRLEKFYLMDNKLTNIPDDFFDGLDSLAYVYLDQNPWICNCALKYFKEWVEENGHNVYYMSDGTPINDEYSVRCSDKSKVIDFNTDSCVIDGHGKVDQHKIPANKITKAPPANAETTKPTMTPTETSPTTTMTWTTRTITTTTFRTTIITSTEQGRTIPQEVTTSIVHSTTTLDPTVKVEPIISTTQKKTLNDNSH